MATKHHSNNGGDSIKSKLKNFFNSLLEPPRHRPVYDINSIERENGKIYRVNISLIYTFATPALINTVSKEVELIFVKKEGDVKFVPQEEYHKNLSDDLINDCKTAIEEKYY